MNKKFGLSDRGALKMTQELDGLQQPPLNNVDHILKMVMGDNI